MEISSELIKTIISIVGFIIGVVLLLTVVLKIVSKNINTSRLNEKKEMEKYKKYNNIDTSIIYKEMDLNKIDNHEELKNTLFDMFKNVLKAYTKLDYNELKRLTNDVVYMQYYDKIKELKDRREVKVIKNVNLDDIRILDVKNSKGSVTIKFYLNITSYSYTIDKKLKFVRSGFDDRRVKQEYLVSLEGTNEDLVISNITKIGQRVLKKESKNGKGKK